MINNYQAFPDAFERVVKTKSVQEKLRTKITRDS